MFFESFLLNVIIMIVLIVALLFDYITKFFSYWYVRHIPYKQPIPCFGSDFERVVGLRGTTETVKTLYHQNPTEKFVGYITGRIPDLIVKDLEVIKLILSTDFAHFHEKGLCLDKSQDICIKNNLFYAEGEKWTLFRKQLELILENYTSDLSLIDEISNKNSQHYVGEVNLNELLGPILDKIFANYLIKCDIGNNFLTRLRHSFQTQSLQNRLKSYLKTIFPSLYTLLGVTTLSNDLLKNGRSALGKLTFDDHNILKIKVMESHKALKNGKTNDSCDDVFSGLCAIMSEAYIPCYNVVISVLYELARNDQIQDKARNIAKTTHRVKDADDSSKCNDYIDCVIKETMRLYPTHSIISRKCVKAYKIPDTDIVIDKGVTVTIPVEAIQKDSKYYSKSERFDPDRFSEEGEANKHPNAYIPFGAGPRKCPGAKLAHMVVRSVVSSILMNYKLEPAAGTPKALIYKDYNFKRVLSQDVWLNITPLH